MWVLLLAIAWVGGGTLLGFLSGWYGLMSRYPDRAERSLFVLKYQSGSLGLVRLRRVLHLGVCNSGLRVGIMILAGPFSRDFLVPWSHISVGGEDGSTTVLNFGLQRLSLSSEVADQLARAAASRWPEPGPLPEATVVPRRWLKWWAVPATVAAAVLVVVPLMSALNSPRDARPAFFLSGLFLPAAFFGLALLVERLRQR